MDVRVIEFSRRRLAERPAPLSSHFAGVLSGGTIMSDPKNKPGRVFAEIGVMLLVVVALIALITALLPPA